MAASVLSFAEEIVPAMRNWRQPDGERPARVFQNGGWLMRMRTALPVDGSRIGQAVVVVPGGADSTAGALLAWVGFIWNS